MIQRISNHLIYPEKDFVRYSNSQYYNFSEKNAKPKIIQHEKGTLIEGIYGVICLEFGFEELIRTIPLIQ